MRILHLSDLHYGFQAFAPQPQSIAPGVWATTLSKSVKDALGDGADIDAIVVSGDITNRAEASEFSAAANGLRHLAGALSIRMRDVVVTPGNHDVSWTLAKGPTPASRFDPYRHFLDELYTSEEAAALYGDSRDGFVAVHEIDDSLAIGTVSSSRFETHQDHYGWVGADQLDRLSSALSRNSAFWKVVVLHHHLLPTPAEGILSDPPSNTTATVDVSIVRDSGLVLRKLGELGVQLVLHGHKHDPVWRYHSFLQHRARGVVLLGAGSSAVHREQLAHDQRNHFQVVDIGGTTVPTVAEFEFVNVEWRPRARRTLWQAYDEVSSLQNALAEKFVRGEALLAIVARAAHRCPQWYDSDQVQEDTLARSLEQVTTPAKARDAFYWLIVYGVLEFDDIQHWYDREGVEISDTEPYVHLSERGRLLLSRLSEG